MTSYKIFWKPKAVGDLESLNRDTQTRIIEKIESITGSPNRFLEWIKKYGVYRLRVGDYRVFVDMNQSDKRIEILTIRHRSKAYKKTVN